MVPAPRTATARIREPTDFRIRQMSGLRAECRMLRAGAACWCLRAGAACWRCVLALKTARTLPSPAHMGVDKYRDLQCWQLANQLKLAVYALVNKSSARHD